MLLSKIPEYINCRKIYNIKNKDHTFNFISTNSKQIKNKSVLIVNNKKKFKKKYIFESIKKGGVAIITDRYYKDITIPQFLVKNTDQGFINKLLFALKSFPPNNFVGITGTNGKTSAVWNIANILYYTKRNVKTYGTLGYFKNLKKIEDSSLTTPEYEILYQKAYENSKKNISEFIFEVSSHSIVKKRIDNIPINIAGITNISQDHLDFHKTITKYRKTKFRLFIKHLKNEGTAILNDNINKIQDLKKKLLKRKIRILTYGTKTSDIYIYKKNNKTNIRIRDKLYSAKLNNYNNFELENLSCSVGCCISLGIKNRDVINALVKIKKPKGRLEEIGTIKNGSRILVDYAHTPDALKSVLIESKKNNKKPNVLFGCGGNRDKSKRKIMGLIANKFAAKVYITDDNPRNEDPSKIRQTILSKCSKAIEISNRREAIKLAINELNKGETLIIAGKGHEKKQIIRDKILNFDDAKIAKYYLNQRNKIWFQKN